MSEAYFLLNFQAEAAAWPRGRLLDLGGGLDGAEAEAVVLGAVADASANSG